MKKTAISIALLFCSAVYARSPDLAPTWRALNQEKYEMARDRVAESFDSLPKEWPCCHCEESHQMVKDLMHLYLSQFYIAYLMKDRKGMERISEGMKNIILLEYRLENP